MKYSWSTKRKNSIWKFYEIFIRKRNKSCLFSGTYRDILRDMLVENVHVIFTTVYRSGFYPRFSRYSRSRAKRTRSIYNIWNFLGNLAATLVINITFRRANQPTGGEIPFEFILVVRISGFTILPAWKSSRTCITRPGWKIARHSKGGRWHRVRRFAPGGIHAWNSFDVP